MRRTILAIALVIFLGLLATIGAFGLGYYQLTKPYADNTEKRLFEVTRGQGLSAIAKNLHDGRWIASPFFIKLAGKFHKVDHLIHAGEYEIPAMASSAEILDILTSGKVFLRQVTIPEGASSWEVVQILNAEPMLSGEIATQPPEGSLLPETYAFTRSDTRQAILDRMTEAQRTFLDSIWEGRDADLPISTKEEAIILASIIEKETGVPSERGQVAGVFVNRLKKGMLLQTDPTAIYAIKKGQGALGRKLYKKDLEVDSPYNTYKYAGLPPGPICNPGKDSLKAALNPEKHDFIYFVADGTGGHVFAKTLDEHNKNVANWRKIRRNLP